MCKSMSPDAFRAALARLGVTQVEAASLLGGVDKQTINRWATGARAVPPTVVALLQLIEAIGVKRARKIISKSEPGETT
jgi:DNA-binding transcriptional regulator YiaG